MSLPVAIVLVVLGLVVLAGGGEVLLRGALAVSRRLHLSPAVVGLTIVALATSLPELAVSVTAALKGKGDVAVGNVVGSNMFNIAAIVGISALLFPPLRFDAPRLRLDLTVMMVACGAAALVAQNRTVSGVEGIVLVAAIVLYLTLRVRAVRGQMPQGIDVEARSGSLLGSLALVLAGAALLTAGAEVLVRGAVRLAELAGVSERVIAVTLISAGTGLPELTTAIIAGLRKHVGVAVGNIVGSNIFNSFGILGIAAMVRPLSVAPEIASRDVWWMLGLSGGAVFLALHRRRRLSRWEGLVIFLAYVAYLVTLLR